MASYTNDHDFLQLFWKDFCKAKDGISLRITQIWIQQMDLDESVTLSSVNNANFKTTKERGKQASLEILDFPLLFFSILMDPLNFANCRYGSCWGY